MEYSVSESTSFVPIDNHFIQDANTVGKSPSKSSNDQVFNRCADAMPSGYPCLDDANYKQAGTCEESGNDEESC